MQGVGLPCRYSSERFDILFRFPRSVGVSNLVSGEGFGLCKAPIEVHLLNCPYDRLVTKMNSNSNNDRPPYESMFNDF